MTKLPALPKEKKADRPLDVPPLSAIYGSTSSEQVASADALTVSSTGVRAEKQLVQAELAATLSSHLLSTFLALTGDLPILHWQKFHKTLDRANRRVELLDEGAQALSAVLEALGARVSNHSAILGRGAPALGELRQIAGQRGLSEYGVRRTGVYESMLERAVGIIDKLAIWRKPSAYAVAALLLLEELLPRRSSIRHLNPHSAFGRTAVSQLGMLVKQAEGDGRFRFKEGDLKPNATDGFAAEAGLLDLKMTFLWAWVAESFQIARTGEESYTAEHLNNIAQRVQTESYEGNIDATINRPDVSRLQLVVEVQPLIFLHIGELNRRCGELVVQKDLSGSMVSLEEITALLDKVDDYHHKRMTFLKRLYTLQPLDKTISPDADHLRDIFKYWLRYNAYGEMNIILTLHDYVVTKLGRTDELADRCKRAMFQGSIEMLKLCKESMSADPLKVLEAGRAFNDISMFAKYLAEQPCVYGVYDQDAKRADLEIALEALRVRSWAETGFDDQIIELENMLNGLNMHADSGILDQLTPARISTAVSITGPPQRGEGGQPEGYAGYQAGQHLQPTLASHEANLSIIRHELEHNEPYPGSQLLPLTTFEGGNLPYHAAEVGEAGILPEHELHTDHTTHLHDYQHFSFSPDTYTPLGAGSMTVGLPASGIPERSGYAGVSAAVFSTASTSNAENQVYQPTRQLADPQFLVRQSASLLPAGSGHGQGHDSASAVPYGNEVYAFTGQQQPLPNQSPSIWGHPAIPSNYADQTQVALLRDDNTSVSLSREHDVAHFRRSQSRMECTVQQHGPLQPQAHLSQALDSGYQGRDGFSAAQQTGPYTQSPYGAMPTQWPDGRNRQISEGKRSNGPHVQRHLPH